MLICFRQFSFDILLGGYDYAMEKAGSSTGWSFTYLRGFNQGYPHELAHFIKCVREDLTPKVTGEDGRAVLEMLYASYASAASGKRWSYLLLR